MDAVRAPLRRMREPSPAELANRAYEPHEEVDRPGSFLSCERCTDRAGFEAQRETGHVAELIRGTDSRC
ncbi:MULTISPECIES: putative quinol monooxygenase [Streptomyces]|uniref:putative quinol monooxygenase n=1 Tax=Streptomyces TaxID=1883 RepID=UPI000A60EB03|nr:MULTISPECIES: hypothetical protein [Streptomyces]